MSANKILIKLWYLHTDKILPNHYKLQMKRTDKLQSYKCLHCHSSRKPSLNNSPLPNLESYSYYIFPYYCTSHHSIYHILHYYLFNFPSFFQTISNLRSDIYISVPIHRYILTQTHIYIHTYTYILPFFPEHLTHMILSHFYNIKHSFIQTFIQYLFIKDTSELQGYCVN